MLRQTLTVTLALLLVATVAVSPAAAASNDPIDEWMTTVEESQDEEPDGIFDRIRSYAPSSAVNGLAAIDGQLDRAISNPFADVPTNDDTATEFERVVQANNATFEKELNSNSNFTSASDTHAVMIAHEDSDPVTVFLVGDVSNGNISNLRVLDRPEFNETNRETDELWVVDGDAAENLPTLTTSIAERINNGESMGTSYQQRLGGRYCSAQAPWKGKLVDLQNCDIRSTIWMDEQAVLEGGDE
ncbi:hypothetical protein [Haloarcula amylovorans]|uniref:hypothetical protein n=1 Tax=Haloarcula amylovorans TaxID=2562280 RepID=UPI00107642C8|nr:hypothetical protein [Halomicroarcula amylolytica]